MKKWLNNYYSFTKREYNGLLALMAILLIVSILPYMYTNYFLKEAIVNNTEEAAIQKLVLVNQKHENNYTKIRTQTEDSETRVVKNLFKFDPNRIDLQQWQALGLSVKQAQSIINYRSKGGKFYKPADLQKMYTITPQKFQELAPYITIENNNETSRYAKTTYPEKTPYVKKEFVIVELNTADTLQLDKIKGVGAAFARRIANYRNKLGGFYKKEQLLEVYGLDSIKYNEIKDQVKINSTHLTKININTAEFDQLKNHPYLTYKQINAIINYRKQHGKYNSVDDLKKVLILSPQTIQNITPYLNF